MFGRVILFLGWEKEAAVQCHLAKAIGPTRLPVQRGAARRAVGVPGVQFMADGRRAYSDGAGVGLHVHVTPRGMGRA